MEWNSNDLDTSKLGFGDVINYGHGTQGIVLPKTMDAAQARDLMSAYGSEDIGGGLSLAAAAGMGDGYMGMHGQDRAMMRYAAQAIGNLSRGKGFGLDFFQDDIDTTVGIPTDQTASMELAEKFFYEDAIAGKVVELMAQFSIAGFKHQLKDEKVRQFYDDWAIATCFSQTLKQAFLGYYLSGNVYIMKTLVNFKQGKTDPDYKYKVDPDLDKMTRREANEITRAEKAYDIKLIQYLAGNIEYDAMKDFQEKTIKKMHAARKHVWSKSMIPGLYTVLDPKAIEIDGPGEFGLGIMKYAVSSELEEVIKAPETPHQKQIVLSLPRDFVNQIRTGNDVILDPNLTSKIHRMKSDYEPLAFPLMHRAFRALHMKNRLRELDSATIDSIISQMVIVKIGTEKLPARKSHLIALATAWLEAVQTKTLYLFWDHTIEVERVEVNMDVLGREKYEQWNDDIKDAFGISPVLLGRVEGSATSGYVSVKGFIENLETGRQDILEQFVYPEYHGIAAAMGFPGHPEVVFDKFNLQDESAVKNIIIKLVQSGIISFETASTELGYDWKQELERHTNEKPLKESGIIAPMSPNTQDTNQEGGGRPPGEPAPKKPTPKSPTKPKDKTIKS